MQPELQLEDINADIYEDPPATEDEPVDEYDFDPEDEY
jgi:hypothetical protein